MTSSTVDKFVLYEHSQDHYPGKAPGESLRYCNDTSTEGVASHVEAIKDYAVLATNLKWRILLSNYGNSPFVLDDLKWSSVAHYCAAMKFKNIPHAWDKLATDSFESPTGLEARAQARRFTLKGDEIKRWDSIKDAVESNAIAAKFAQNEDLLKILIATGDAELYYSERNVGMVRCTELEKIRNKHLHPNDSGPTSKRFVVPPVIAKKKRELMVAATADSSAE